VAFRLSRYCITPHSDSSVLQFHKQEFVKTASTWIYAPHPSFLLDSTPIEGVTCKEH